MHPDSAPYTPPSVNVSFSSNDLCGLSDEMYIYTLTDLGGVAKKTLPNTFHESPCKPNLEVTFTPSHAPRFAPLGRLHNHPNARRRAYLFPASFLTLTVSVLLSLIPPRRGSGRRGLGCAAPSAAGAAGASQRRWHCHRRGTGLTGLAAA